MIRRLVHSAAPIFLLTACAGGEVTPNVVLHLAGGFVYAPAAGSEAAGYVTIDNRSPLEDTLLVIRSPGAGMVHLHRQVPDGGMVRMVPVERLPIPPGITRLEPGGLHLMLMALTGTLSPGDSVDLTFAFVSAGEHTVRVPVIAYGDAPPPPPAGERTP